MKVDVPAANEIINNIDVSTSKEEKDCDGNNGN